MHFSCFPFNFNESKFFFLCVHLLPHAGVPLALLINPSQSISFNFKSSGLQEIVIRIVTPTPSLSGPVKTQPESFRLGSTSHLCRICFYRQRKTVMFDAN